MSEGEQRGRGRPSKLTAEVIAALCESLSLGATYEIAAEAAGIGVSTFYEWKAAAKEGDPDLAEFLEVLKKAEAQGAVDLLKTIRDAATKETDGQWQAAAWILERRHRDGYGRHQHIDHEITAKASITSQVAESLRKHAEAELQGDEDVTP